MFICTGNICRSAMAHWLFVKKIEESNLKDIKVYSSGIHAEDGDISTYNAIEVMKEYDIDLKKHKAVNIRNSNIKKMDLILCMTKSHKLAIYDIYPDLKDKVYTLKEYVKYDDIGKDIDIRDPWGYDIETYRFCLAEIDKCLDILLNKLKNK